MDTATARRFRTGRRCLDFAHTGGVGRWMHYELIHTAQDADRWLAYLLGVPSVTAAAADLAPTRELRESIWQLAQARIAGTDLPDEHIATVNRFAAQPPLIPVLTKNGTKTATPDVVCALSALARDAVDLFGGPLGRRVRACAANDCDLLFVDASPPGRRRWCSMQRCGNRAKVRTNRQNRSEK